ncbi:MAG: addiction module antidote protein, HigA family [Acidobacteria bacterium]|nr:MAG: addiction module antidote protein, HigA family [Acidobacteriota bacterium]
MDTNTVAEVFPPGEFIKEELEARGWTQDDLADILGRHRATISAIVNGKREISADIARDLGAAFGTSAQYWMNLETGYRLFSETHSNESVARKANLFRKAPIKEMIRRNWINGSTDLTVLEESVLSFFEIKSLDDKPKIMPHAAKKSTSYESMTPAQIAWLYRAKKIARGVQAEKFSTKSLGEIQRKLKQLLANPEDVRHVPKTLAEGGIRLLLIEPLPQTKIDGICFWLDDTSPVIALALRYDRLDHFWYLLGHECGHVSRKDGLGSNPYLDINLVGDDAVSRDDKPQAEIEADEFAGNFLVDQTELEKFIARTAPLYSKQKIRNFAMRIGVHPAIVLGQLQHRGEVEWSHSREMLVKVRELAISTAVTDGWGHFLPAVA